MTDQDRAILEAVWREMDEGDRENGPGHAHSRPGIWDDDNRPSIAGKPCAWCLTWKKFTALAAPSRQVAQRTRAHGQLSVNARRAGAEMARPDEQHTAPFPPPSVPLPRETL